MSLRSIRKYGSKKEVARVHGIIRRCNRIKFSELVCEVEKKGVSKSELRTILASLMGEGKVYKPSRGVLECVDY